MSCGKGRGYLCGYLYIVWCVENMVEILWRGEGKVGEGGKVMQSDHLVHRGPSSTHFENSAARLKRELTSALKETKEQG